MTRCRGLDAVKKNESKRRWDGKSCGGRREMKPGWLVFRIVGEEEKKRGNDRAPAVVANFCDFLFKRS